jgi:hypothetical protein
MVAPLSAVSTPEADTTDTSAERAPLTNKAVVSKSPYSLGTPSGNVGIDPQLLANMQQLIDEREARKNSLNEAMRDATAWWSGGAAGPGEALARRAKEREEETATTFGMKRDLAQAKIAADQAKADMASLSGVVSGTGGAGAAGGAGKPPTLVANEITRLLQANRIEEAKAVYNKWLTTESGNISKSTYGAAENTQAPTFIQGIGSIQLTPNEKRVYDNTGDLPSTLSPDIRSQAKSIWQESRPKTEGVLPHQKPLEKISAPTEKPVGTTSSTTVGGNAVQIANALNVPIISGDRNTAKQKEIWDESVTAGRPGRTASGNPIAKPGTSLHESGNAIDVDPARFTESDAQKLTKAGFSQIPGDKNHWQLAPAANASLPQQKAALQVSSTTPARPAANANLPFPNPKNPEEEKANAAEVAKRAAIPTEAAAKEANTAAEATGKELGAAGQHKQQAVDTIGAADRVINLADDKAYNKLMGYFEGGNKAATVIVKGLNWATAKLFGQEEFEKAIAALAFTPEERTRLNNLRTDATKLGIEYTAQMFKGARLGIGLEKLGSEGKGLSASFTPETNKLYAQITKDNAQFVLDSHKAFNGPWLASHPGATWGDFMRSKEYDVMLDNHLAKEQKLTAGSGIKLEKLSADQADKAEKGSGSSFDKYVIKKPK